MLNQLNKLYHMNTKSGSHIWTQKLADNLLLPSYIFAPNRSIPTKILSFFFLFKTSEYELSMAFGITYTV